MGHVLSQHRKSRMKVCSSLGRYEVDCIDGDWPCVTKGEVPANTLLMRAIHVSFDPHHVVPCANQRVDTRVGEAKSCSANWNNEMCSGQMEAGRPRKRGRQREENKKKRGEKKR